MQMRRHRNLKSLGRWEGVSSSAEMTGAQTVCTLQQETRQSIGYPYKKNGSRCVFYFPKLPKKKKKGNSSVSGSIPQDDIHQVERETTIKSFPQSAFLHPQAHTLVSGPKSYLLPAKQWQLACIPRPADGRCRVWGSSAGEMLTRPTHLVSTLVTQTTRCCDLSEVHK